MIELGRKIAAARDALGWTQLQLADATGLSRVYVSRLENGHELNPTVSTLVAVAEALGLHPNAVRFADCPAAEAAADLLESRAAFATSAERQMTVGALVDLVADLQDGQPLRVMMRQGTLYVARMSDTASNNQQVSAHQPRHQRANRG